jgi:hypothetical protein
MASPVVVPPGVDPLFIAITRFNRRDYGAAIAICSSLLEAQPYDQAAWYLKVCAAERSPPPVDARRRAAPTLRRGSGEARARAHVGVRRQRTQCARASARPTRWLTRRPSAPRRLRALAARARVRARGSRRRAR